MTSRLGPSIVGGVKKRQASFVQPMNPAATGETSQQGPPTALPTSLSQPASRTGSFQAHPLAAQQEAARAFRERMIATR